MDLQRPRSPEADVQKALRRGSRLNNMSLKGVETLPEPAVFAQEILDAFQSALQHYAAVAAELE